MQNREVPDATQRAELVRKATKLQSICNEIRSSDAHWVANGQSLTEQNQLSDEAECIQQKGDFDTTERITEDQGPKLIEWAKTRETQGLPVPAEYAEIIKLIDLL